jgi:hypothetical protein
MSYVRRSASFIFSNPNRAVSFGYSRRQFNKGAASGSRLTKISPDHSSERTAVRSELRRIEVLSPFELRGADQFSVEAVGPAVISAAEQLLRTTAFSSRSGTMSANIVETANFAVALTHDQQRLAHEFGGEIVARIRDLIAMPNHLSGPAENLFGFDPRRHRIDIEGSGQGPIGVDVSANTERCSGPGHEDDKYRRTGGRHEIARGGRERVRNALFRLLLH